MADSNSIEWDLLKLHDSFTLVEVACIVINSLPANITKLSATNDEPYGSFSLGVSVFTNGMTTRKGEIQS